MGDFILQTDSVSESRSILLTTSPFHKDVLANQKSSNVFPDNTLTENVGDVVEFSTKQNDEEKMCIAKSREYKVKQGDFWYNIVKKEYGVTKHEKVMEIVHILKDINHVDRSLNSMPKKFELLSEVIMSNGEVITLLDPPMEKCVEIPHAPKQEEPETVVSEKTQETKQDETDDCVPEVESKETQDTNAASKNEQKKFPMALRDMPNHYKIAEVKTSTTTFDENGEPKTVVGKYFTNVEVIELEPAQKDETGKVVKERSVVFKCDQGIFLEDVDGYPGGEPISEEVLQDFLKEVSE